MEPQGTIAPRRFEFDWICELFPDYTESCLQPEGLAALSPGQGGFAPPPWVVSVKILSLKG